MDGKRKFRLSLCYMIFADMEVEATTAREAEQMAVSLENARRKFSTGPAVHRVEKLIPDRAKPGSFRWVEVERGTEEMPF